MNTLIEFKLFLDNRKRYLFGELHHLNNMRKDTFSHMDRSFQDKTYPEAKEIFNLLNPLYLTGIKDAEKIFSSQYILVRDGFFPLMDFFYRYSSPGGSEVILLIHEKLQFLIPKNWIKNVLTYSFKKNFNYKESRIKPRSFYLFAMSYGGGMSQENFKERIKKVKEAYSNQWNNIDLKIAVLLRQNPCFDEPEEILQDVFYFTKEIYEEFGFNAQFCVWKDIEDSHCFRHSCYDYIVEDYFNHAYSYVDHFFISRRCMPFTSRFDSKSRGDMIMKMFPDYDIYINEYYHKENDLWDEILDAARFLGVSGTLFSKDFFRYSIEISKRYLQ